MDVHCGNSGWLKSECKHIEGVLPAIRLGAGVTFPTMTRSGGSLHCTSCRAVAVALDNTCVLFQCCDARRDLWWRTLSGNKAEHCCHTCRTYFTACARWCGPALPVLLMTVIVGASALLGHRARPVSRNVGLTAKLGLIAMYGTPA